MFSYEDRIRAVKLYIKLGKPPGATIRQLGYPTKNESIQKSGVGAQFVGGNTDGGGFWNLN